jgi:hypothetical protein
MEALLVLIATFGLLTVIGLLANRYGADSRSYDLNDWGRSVAS